MRLLDFIWHHFHKCCWLMMVWGFECSKTALFTSVVSAVGQLMYWRIVPNRLIDNFVCGLNV